MSILPTRRARAVAAGLAGALVAGTFAVLGGASGTPASASPPPAAHAPVVKYVEDFEHLDDPALGTFLDDYSGATGMTYDADGAWIDGPGCNGVIASNRADSDRNGTCTQSIWDAWATQLAKGFGKGDSNHALIDTTVSGTTPPPPPPAATFRTVDPIDLGASNRFVAFSVDVSVICNAGDPRLTFYLIDGATEHKVTNTPINPCTDAGLPGTTGTVAVSSNRTARFGTYATDTALLFGGDEARVKLTNESSALSGNDYAIDNVTVLDATPTVSKDFAPAVVQSGQTSRLTFTVTNTTEKAAKPGWSFSDALPAGLKVAPTPNAASSCASATFAPAAGASSLSITGDLGSGQVACPLGVDVVAADGTYTNGPSNVTTTGLDGLDGSATVKFNTPPTVTSGPAEGETIFVGQDSKVTFSCADSDGTIASCSGSVPSGTSINTSTPGSGSYTVTATDNDGGTTTVTKHYTVVQTAGLCRGRVLGLPLGIDIADANKPEVPCATKDDSKVDYTQTLGVPGPLSILNSSVKAGVLLAHSRSGPGVASADATVAKVAVSIPSLALSLEVTGVTTSAKSQLTSCVAPATLTSESRIAQLKLNGAPINVGDQELTIPLGVGALYVNQKVVVGNTIVRRAVFLDLPGTALDVIVAESKAGATCVVPTPAP